MIKYLQPVTKAFSLLKSHLYSISKANRSSLYPVELHTIELYTVNAESAFSRILAGK